MPIITSSAITMFEWGGVASSLAGSVLNARGRRCSFYFWTLSAVLLAVVAFQLGRPGLLALQASGIGINLYGIRTWKGNAPTRL